MDIVQSKQMPGDDLKKVMQDLADDGVGSVKVEGSGKPENVSPPPPPSTPPPVPVAASTAPAQQGASDLDNIKLSAVEMLKPLIGSLDISAEEKFEAMIEIIRASDDQDMIAQAFNTAKAIGDNDRRAQALIDIINEINYINKIKKA